MVRSPLITEAGATRLRNELADLWKNKRPAVTKALAEAAAEGDRSENAEYIYRKKQLREMDRRIRYLQKRTSEFKVVERKPNDESRIYFAAWISLENEHGEEVIFRIVGSDEFDFEPNYISIDSPLAKALLKKAIDDEVVVNTPKGVQTYLVNNVWYN